MKSKQFIAALVTLCLCTSLSFHLHSQVLISLLFGDELNSDKVKFGLDGGFNFSNLTGTGESKFIENLNLGLYFDIQLKAKSHWYVHTGALLKSEMGARGIDVYSLDDPGLDSIFLGGDIERQLRYINFPALIRYKHGKHFFIEAGPMFGILTNATDVFYQSINKDDDLSFNNKVTDHFHWFDMGIEAGFGYQLMKGTGVNFGIRYYQGLLAVLKDNSSDPSWNQSLYLFVSIPVGAGEKSKAKKAEKELKKSQKN
jgi:Outer membrane protein beta-barrel domain